MQRSVAQYSTAQRNATRVHKATIIIRTQHNIIQHIIIWLPDFACCDWSIPGP